MANEYTIDFLDPATKASRSFVIQPNTADGPGKTQQNTDLTLFGRGHLEYGEFINENFIRLLEHFAAPEDLYPVLSVDLAENEIVIADNRVDSFPINTVAEIEESDANDGTYTVEAISYNGNNNETTIKFLTTANGGLDLVGDTGNLGRLKHPSFGLGFPDPTMITTPVKGQGWYDTTNDVLNTYDGTQWTTAGGKAAISSTEPENAKPGDFWYNLGYGTGRGPCIGEQLMIHNGTAFVSTGDNYLPLDGANAMCGNLDMATYDISNVGTINTIDAITTIVGNIGSVQKVFLQTDAATGNEAVRRSYADSRYVNVTGDNMTGQLTLVKSTNGQLTSQLDLDAPSATWTGNYYEVGNGSNIIRSIDPAAPSPLFLKMVLNPGGGFVEVTIENKRNGANNDANHNIYLPTTDNFVAKPDDVFMFIKEDDTSHWTAFAVSRADGQAFSSSTTGGGYDYFGYFNKEHNSADNALTYSLTTYPGGFEFGDGYIITVEGNYNQVVYGGNAYVTRTYTYRQTYIYDASASTWRKI